MDRRRRWPKGAFPEKYRWRSVQTRLDDARPSEKAAPAFALLRDNGFSAFELHSDPYVQVFSCTVEEIDVRSLQNRLRDEPVFVFEWLAPEPEDDRIKLGVVASADPIDAVVAVGVAGPQQGIGTAAVVRFLLALRAYAEYSIVSLGDDFVRLEISPRDEAAAIAVAERVLELCKGMARSGANVDQLKSRMIDDHVLELDWRG